MIRQTPLIASPDLAEKTGAAQIHLKLECLQNTGSFKVRGAANKILSLSDEQKQKGVITFSTGNHGKAVAYVAGQIGIASVVCLSEHVAAYRVAMIKALGAEVSLKGRSQDEAEKNYRQLTAARGLVPVVPFDDPMIIAGQGTIALEILSELPETDILMIQLSGGGLLAGIPLEIAYQQGWAEQGTLLQCLAKNREKDIRTGYTGVGIHRDDISMTTRNRKVGEVLSRGQSKRVCLALLMAVLQLVNDACGSTVVLLIDDLHSELDNMARELVYREFAGMKIQLFISNIDNSVPAGIDVKECKMFHVEHGIIRPRNFS